MSFEAGMIVIWGKKISEIPSGWALCDGRHGTPDLRDKFIKGFSTRSSAGQFGGSSTFTPSGTISSVSAGTPAGSVSAPTISWPAGVPTIGAYTPAGTNSAPTISGSTAAEASHTHSTTLSGNTGSGGNSATGNAGFDIDATVESPGSGYKLAYNSHTHPSHSHTMNTGPFTSGAGSSHSHGAGTLAASAPTFTGTAWTPPAIAWPAGVPTNSTPSFTGSALGTHNHTFTGSAGDIDPPHYEAVFIMKL